MAASSSSSSAVVSASKPDYSAFYPRLIDKYRKSFASKEVEMYQRRLVLEEQARAKGIAVEPVAPDFDLCTAMLDHLFDMQERRTTHVAESRRLMKDMESVKKFIIGWMEKNVTDAMAVSDRKRQMKRKERKIYKKVSRDHVLDWIEMEFGGDVRRRFEARIQAEEKMVRGTAHDYKITFMGVRQRGEKMPGAMPPRKRAKKEDAKEGQEQEEEEEEEVEEEEDGEEEVE